MSYKYSNIEYTEMVRVLAKSHDNVARACHEFQRLFPNLPAPSTGLMLQATQRLRDHGQFQPRPSEMVSEEDEGQESGGHEEEGDSEEGDDEEENGEKEEEKEEALKPVIKKDPPITLPTTKVFSLGHISNVEASLSRFKTQDQKILHQYLYGQLCPDHNVTDNIKKFKGFKWPIDSTEYKAKLMETARMEPRHLRAMCDMLDLENKGGPSELATRLMGFLQQLGASYPKVSEKPPVKTDNRGAAFAWGPRRTRSHSPPSVTRRDEYESENDTKGNDSKEGSKDSDASGSSKTSGSEASDSGSERDDVIGTEGREAEAKVIPDRQRSPPDRQKKKNARDMIVRSTKGEKASSEESYEGEESSEEEVEEEGSDEEESGSESDTPADKKAKRSPTDEEIKKYVKQILEGANLEQITMKSLCKQVYSHYPDFNLEHKKDFIKSTVKSLL